MRKARAMRNILGLVFFLVLTVTCFGQSIQELEVKGYGRLTTQPDLGVLNVEITTIQNEFGSAISSLNSNYEKIINHLEREGFKKEEIKTRNYSVHENTIYRNGAAYDSGFVGQQSILVEFENTKENLSKIIESFQKSPVDAKFSFSFTISNAKREDLRNEIIKKAIDDAKQKANLIAETSGLQLGKIKEIKYGTFPTENYFGTYGESLFMEIPATEQPSSEAMGFDVKEVAFRDYVVIIYELK